jgi:polyisoprenoid-binding protein YceI
MTATQVQTIETPAPGTYVVDPIHSTIGFVARHLVGAKVRGHFSEFSGTVHIGADPDASSVEASVQAASISTGEERRDAHLRTGDFLEVAQFPTLTLASTQLIRQSDTDFTLVADLTIRGVTRSVNFDLEYLGAGAGMAENSTVVGFSASAEIDRRDFGVSFSASLDNGGLIVGNKVRLELEIEAHATTA